MRIIGAYNTTGADAAPSLQAAAFVQEFVAPLDNLHKAEIMFAVPPELHDQPLKAEIVEADSGQIIRTATAITNKGEQDVFVEFEFEPIKESKQQKYQLVVGPEILDLGTGVRDAVNLPPILVDQALQLKVSDVDYYQQGDLYIDGQKTEQDLVFRTFHQIEGSYANFVLDSLTSKITTDPIFFSFWLMLVAGSVLVAFFGMFRALFLAEK